MCTSGCTCTITSKAKINLFLFFNGAVLKEPANDTQGIGKQCGYDSLSCTYIRFHPSIVIIYEKNRTPAPYVFLIM